MRLSAKNMKLINIIKMPIDYNNKKTLKMISYKIKNLTGHSNYDVKQDKSVLPLYFKQDKWVYKLTIMATELIIKIYKENEPKKSNTDIKFAMPANFQGSLDLHQKKGINWMLNKLDKGKGCLLADDMGLGKTIQIIGTLLYLKNHGKINNMNKALILVPKALVKQWFNEIKKFTPTLKVYIYKLDNYIPECDIIIFTHDQAYKQHELIKKINIYLLVIDEAQKVKTPEALMTKCFKTFNYTKIILVTGTPFENTIKDGLCLLDFIYENFYDNIKKVVEKNTFTLEYCNTIKNCLSSSILRRIKNKENIPNLPNLSITTIKCELSDLQREAYSKFVPITSTYKQIFKTVGAPLITTLKQVCNVIASEIPMDPQNKNSKIYKLLEIYETIPEGKKLVIISQSTLTLDHLEVFLNNQGITNIQKFNGKLSSKQRNQELLKFKESTKKEILLLSLKAGGIGLNLQEASYVIIYDLWWNKAAEQQSIARVYRRGQKFDVKVYRLINDIPFENSIDDFINEKAKKIDLIWQVINNPFETLSFKQQNDFYSFIFDLRFKFSRIGHVPTSQILSHKGYSKLWESQSKDKLLKNSDEALSNEHNKYT